MPVFSLDIEKYLIGQPSIAWTNQYHTEQVTIDDAVDVANGLVTLETAIHSTSIFILQFRVSTVAAHDDVFRTIPINTQCSRGLSGGHMPLFLAYRVDLVPNVGRNGRKFYHLDAGEDDQDGGQWSPTLNTDVESAWSAFFGSFPASALVNETGARLYNDFRLYQTVTQHQFRRGSKRKTPILG